MPAGERLRPPPHPRPPPASVLIVGRQSPPIQPTARDAGRGSRATTVSRPAGFLRQPGTRDSVIRCVLVRLAPASAVQFAPELSPNSPKRRENPATRTGSPQPFLAFLSGPGRRVDRDCGAVATPGTQPGGARRRAGVRRRHGWSGHHRTRTGRHSPLAITRAAAAGSPAVRHAKSPTPAPLDNNMNRGRRSSTG
jgi:hypothetical protein